MNDEEPKPGVVIDVTPDAEPDPQGDTRAQQAEAPARRGAIAPLIIAVITLLALIAVAAIGYRYVAQLNTELAALDRQLRTAGDGQRQLRDALSDTRQTLVEQQAQLASQGEALGSQGSAVDEARAALRAQEQQLADENLRLQAREAELRAALADLHRRVGRSSTEWMVAETEYLLRLASHRLALARDVDSARVALELADQRLRDTQDPGWAGVREQLARDIAKLDTFVAPDSAGLAARLGALIEQIPQLRIAHATIGAERTLPERVARTPDERSWDTLLDDLWAGIKDSVRIRERDKPVQAMLAPEHQFFLYENLRLQLQAARLGLARTDAALYRDNLAVAADWLTRFFAADAATTAMQDAIAALRQVDIKPPLPDIGASLRALEQRRRRMRDTTPTDDGGAS